jgi:division protein CdvB (Snf7/Vps24/ESCRT-III family)
MIAKINERDVSLFKRVVDSMQRHDSDTARILSNELGEVRKISRTLGQSKMALEQVSLRLTSIHDMGDAMAALGPAMASVKSLKTSLGRFVPGADTEINNLQSLLNNIMVESIHENGTGVDINTGSGSDIDQILMEASAVAEQRVNDKFPSIPTSQYRKASASESEQ